ncbi:hypothetical protein [Aeromicrobium sp. 179-A 4D2 NHS]|uniref:hypothetical protein n=1 Tax=Aeromicrobium sp. 179-A 4D2 NHS TaxID=3142375 RepID=UPI0039A25D0D
MSAEKDDGSRPAPILDERKRADDDQHFCLVPDLEIAHELGVDVRAFCGVWNKPFKPGALVEKVRDPEGRAWVVPESQDCRECIAVLEANWGDVNR